MEMTPTGGTAAGVALIVAAGLVAVSATAIAQDTGPEWVSRAAEQAKIVFLAPDLEDLRVRYLRGASEDHGYTVEIAFWSGTAAHHPKAMIQYIELSPGRHFRTRQSPKRIIRDFEDFKEQKLVIGRLRRGGNRLGTIESRRFSFDDVQCLGFVVYWGSVRRHPRQRGYELALWLLLRGPGRIAERGDAQGGDCKLRGQGQGGAGHTRRAHGPGLA